MRCKSEVLILRATWRHRGRRCVKRAHYQGYHGAIEVVSVWIHQIKQHIDRSMWSLRLTAAMSVPPFCLPFVALHLDKHSIASLFTGRHLLMCLLLGCTRSKDVNRCRRGRTCTRCWHWISGLRLQIRPNILFVHGLCVVRFTSPPVVISGTMMVESMLQASVSSTVPSRELPVTPYATALTSALLNHLVQVFRSHWKARYSSPPGLQ